MHLVQRLRKEAGYDYSARIALAVRADGAVAESAREHAEFIAGETLARSFEVGGGLDGADREQVFELDGQSVTIAVRQLAAGQSPA